MSLPQDQYERSASHGLSRERHRDRHVNDKFDRSSSTESRQRNSNDKPRRRHDHNDRDDRAKKSRDDPDQADTYNKERRRHRSRSRDRHKRISTSPHKRRSRSRDRNGRHHSRSPDNGLSRAVQTTDHKSHSSRSHNKDRRTHRSHGDKHHHDSSRSSHHHHHRSSRRHHSHSRSRSRSPPRKKSRRSPSPFKRARGPLPSQADSFNLQSDPANSNNNAGGPPAERANFSQTGLLAKAANRVAGTDIVLKYNEPSDARAPPASQDWRLFVFKGAETLDTIPLATRSCWLMGRERAVADLWVEHPSASGQHAVVQFRYVTKTPPPSAGEYGSEKKGKVKPYLIDLDTANGTILNGERIAGRRFVEVRSGDVMKIGSSEREYVFMLPPKD